jgi:hypothetical protein
MPIDGTRRRLVQAFPTLRGASTAVEPSDRPIDNHRLDKTLKAFAVSGPRNHPVSATSP